MSRLTGADDVKVQKARGRPPNRLHSYRNGRVLEYLARMAVNHRVDSGELLNCIVDAWNRGESRCDKLAITCRRKTSDSATFLFTDGQGVKGQFPIPTVILQGPNQLEQYVKRAPAIRPQLEDQGDCPKIRDLKAGMKRINLKARVLELPEPRMVYTRYGTTAYVSNVLIEDETGSIRMSLWNHQIGDISEGDEINVKNGKVTWFSGERQLRLGRNGSFNVI